MNKTICIYHSRDLDGWMSAAIVKKWFIKVSEPNSLIYDCRDEYFNENIATPAELHLLGWDYGDDIPDLKEYDKVIMVDISFPKDEMLKICVKNGTPLVWIDHHISSIKTNNFTNTFKDEDKVYIEGIRDTDFAACELTWMYFFPNDERPEIVRLLGAYDCFRSRGTGEEISVLEFQYGARSLISNYEDCYNRLIECELLIGCITSQTLLLSDIKNEGKTIYKYFCTEAKQTYSKAFNIRFHKHITPSGAVSEIMYSFLCVNQERFNPINFGIDYHKEGYDGFACFWYKDSKWNFSLYNDNNKVDCGVIAKQYGGGGHKGAAGFVVKDLKEVFK